MVPVREVPPGTPLTLQDTSVLVAPVTVPVNVCVVPKSSEAVKGVTLTLTEAGAGVGGGGWATGDLATKLAQPMAHPAATSTARVSTIGERLCDALCEWLPASCERGRMVRRNAGEGPQESVLCSVIAFFLEETPGTRKLLERRRLGLEVKGTCCYAAALTEC